MQPPSKRPRVGDTVDPQSQETDVDEARRANDMRLKSRFEDIFEKYGRDFGPVGDEIDLRTGEIVINNGHLQEMDNEQDIGRGLWDDFHPEDDAEPASNMRPCPDGTPSTKIGRQKSEAHQDGGTQPAVREGNTSPLDARNDQPLKSPWPPYRPDVPANTLGRISPSRTSKQSNGGNGASRAKPSSGSAGMLNSSSPASSHSARDPNIVSGREQLGKPQTSPDMHSRFTSTLQLNTPPPARHRLPSPPGSGSIWAIPGKTRKRTYKVNLQRQPESLNSSEREQISRESPDSDDPLSSHSNFGPISQNTPSKSPNHSTMTQCNNDDFITHPNVTEANIPGQHQPDAAYLNEPDKQQPNDITISEEFDDPALEQLTESTSHEARQDADCLTTYNEAGEQEVELQFGQVESVEGIEKQMGKDELGEDHCDRNPGTPQVTAEVHGTTPVKAPDINASEPEELMSRSFSTSPDLGTSSEELSPRDMRTIVELRVVQRLPWREVVNTVFKSRPGALPLKRLYNVRQSLRENKSEDTQSWTTDERNKLEFMRLTPDVSWEHLMSLFPHKNIEELRREWIRISLANFNTKEKCDAVPSNQEEADGSWEATSTPSRLTDTNSHSPATAPSPLNPINIPEDRHTTRTASDAESQGSESPDPLSAALENSLGGSGLSAMEIDTPPKSARTQRSGRFLPNEAGSPLPKRPTGALT